MRLKDRLTQVEAALPETTSGISLARSLYTAADLQGKEGACTPRELRYLGDLAKQLEEAVERLIG